ncbi:MAG TPA: hypothetical protein VGU27_08910, partial [Candidatus Eisenbacteria bacterium]|nr:hypothetical protein [Candidatus Eisenbacteria bacterium]
MPAPPPPGRPLAVPHVAAVWAPLAGSWFLMGLELPAVSAVMARLPHPAVSLAAYGGVIFPIALLIESPILMLLAASTALARDERSFALIRRFLLLAGGATTLVHVLLAFTPLFDVVAARWIGVPPEVREPARLGLRILLPWSLSIAYRRAHQGLLIRFGRPQAVTYGTLVRLVTEAAVLAAGAGWGRLPGIAVGTSAVACGVVSEGLYAGLAARPIRRGPLRAAAVVEPPLDMRGFVRFYAPLAATPLINFIALPLAAAAMSRMPRPLESLAAWPVLSGITFTLRSTGFAFNEVVVAQLEAWRPVRALRRFATLLSVAVSAVMLVAAVTPLAHWWFGRASALAPPLAGLATAAFWLMIPAPALSVWQSWYQGALVHAHRTRAITESMLVLLVATALVLAAGVAAPRAPGLF